MFVTGDTNADVRNIAPREYSKRLFNTYIYICAPLHPAADSIVVEINPTSYASRLVASSYM